MQAPLKTFESVTPLWLGSYEKHLAVHCNFLYPRENNNRLLKKQILVYEKPRRAPGFTQLYSVD